MSRTAAVLQQVVVVDDDDAVRNGLARILSSPEVEVVTAATADEARRVLDGGAVDLVVCDLCLSGLDDREGLELVSWIKARHGATAVLLVTAFGSAEVRAEALRRGADDYWEKRGPVDGLMKKIRALGIRIRTGSH
jgi:DNA-binding response OmpR family regulator